MHHKISTISLLSSLKPSYITTAYPIIINLLKSMQHRLDRETYLTHS